MVNFMKIILENITNEIIIQKSRFITKLIKIDKIESISSILDYIKAEYKGATHYCYAYIFDNIKRFSDDREPSGTAGIPILNVLEKEDLNHILCIVIRYFGGIKLGTGGLVRAYTSSVTEALKNIDIKELVKAKKIHIIFSYKDSKKIDNLLKDFEILEKVFDQNIEYICVIDLNSYDNIIEKLRTITLSIEPLEEIYI